MLITGTAQVLGQGGLPGVDLQAAPLDGKTKLALQAAVALMAGRRRRVWCAPMCRHRTACCGMSSRRHSV